MRTSFQFVVVSLLFVAVFGIGAGPAHGVTEATRLSDLGGGKIVAMYPWNGGLWLGVENDQHGEIWFSDGTAAGTVHIKDLPETTFQDYWMTIGNVMPVGNALIFNYEYAYYYYVSLSRSPNSIWMSDGTAAGTVMLSDSGYPYQMYTGTLGNVTYFHTSDRSFDVYNFWRSDGTVGGTCVLKPGLETWKSLVLDDLLHFYGATSSGASFGLWRTDGTAEGTYALSPHGGYCHGFAEVGGILCFSWGLSGTGPFRLFRTDGTVEGTYTLQPDGSTLNSYFVLNGILYFFGATNTGAPGLFRSDGTVSGTYRVADTPAEGFSSHDRVVLGNIAVFNVSVAGSHFLWRTDGTSEGSFRLMDGGSSHLTVFGDAVYFFANGGLWKTDGTAAGTGLLFEFDVWGYCDIQAVDRYLLFWCQDEVNGADLCISDGTTAGTMQVDTPWDAHEPLLPQNAEITDAGTMSAKSLPPPPINQVWSQNGVINISCHDGTVLTCLYGTQLQWVVLRDSALGVTAYPSASPESRPVFLGDTVYSCGRYGGLWATPITFRFTETPHASLYEVGDPLLLRVGCAGDVGTISYQWIKDGGLIDGATSAEFRIDSLTEDDEGWYSCRVTDTAKAIHETEPVLVEVFEAGELPAAGPLALFALAAATIAGAARALGRKRR